MSHSNQAQANPTAESMNNTKTLISFCGKKIEYCDLCHFWFTILEVILMIVVVAASGYLLFPFFKFLKLILVTIVGVGVRFVKEEISHSLKLYGSLALGTICIALAGWMILLWIGSKCGKPGCKGLRNAEPFEYRIYTEEDLRSSGERVVRGVVREGMNKYPRELVKEVEARLRSDAPRNGKAVVVHRAKCGCYVGKLEVAGPRSRTVSW